MRLNKFLSQAGVASRRAADQLIQNGRVFVNGRVASLGLQVDPVKDVIKVDGQSHVVDHHKEYLMLNKPINVLSTVTDDRDRRTVIDVVRPTARLYPVGRLDYNSTGLIILTNDGDLSLALTHPRYHLPKTYEVEIDRPLSSMHLNAFKQGIVLDDGKTQPALITLIDASNRRFRIILHQGKNRQIRRMFEHFEYRVLRLHRVAIGPLRIGQLQPGQWRALTSSELHALKSACRKS